MADPRRRAAAEEADAEAALRDAVAHESAEVLRHQLEAERASSSKMRRSEVAVSFFLAGIGFGVGWAGASGRWKKRRGR